MSILNNVFGHTNYTHSLFENQHGDILREVNKKYIENTKLDDTVKFVEIGKGVIHHGKLKERIAGHARVLVQGPSSSRYINKTVDVPYSLFLY
jgi:hypothetical protein